MQITSKGQITIPQAIRNQLGLLPHTEVEWEIVDGRASIRRAAPTGGMSPRARRAIELLWGSASTDLTTDQIMTLTRGPFDDSAPKRKKKR